jgi:hypothetical protein
VTAPSQLHLRYAALPDRVRPHRGFGLRIVRAIATKVSIDANELGTRVRMVFDFRRGERAAEG